MKRAILISICVFVLSMFVGVYKVSAQVCTGNPLCCDSVYWDDGQWICDGAYEPGCYVSDILGCTKRSCFSGQIWHAGSCGYVDGGGGGGEPTPPPGVPWCNVWSELGTNYPIEGDGAQTDMRVGISYGNGTIDYVRFVSDDTSVANWVPMPYDDTKSAYVTSISGVGNPGESATATAKVRMNGAFRCEASTEVTIVSNPTCIVTNSFGTTKDLQYGSNGDFQAYPIPQEGTIDFVRFASTNGSVIEIIPNPFEDSDGDYRINTRAIGGVGETSYLEASIWMGGVERCSTNSLVTVTSPLPWWQVVGADVWTSGDLNSSVLFDNYFDEDADYTPGYPGVPVYGGTTDIVGDRVSSKRWRANSDTIYKTDMNKRFTYEYFRSSLTSEASDLVVDITTPTLSGSYFQSGEEENMDLKGNIFYETNYSGDLTITSDIYLPDNRKVTLFVSDGDLNIEGDVNIVNPGNSIFMAIVRGNINIAPGVEELDGIYVADESFYTGTNGIDSDVQFVARGSVVAWGGVELDRDLPEVQIIPTELFEYAPDLFLNIPHYFWQEKNRWTEVVP